MNKNEEAQFRVRSGSKDNHRDDTGLKHVHVPMQAEAKKSASIAIL
jgi:hypothetical protein